MDASIENVATILIQLMIFFIVFIVGLNCYLIFRNGLYVPVNCWFCNKNSKVLFSNRNSFECIYCQQYNGFKKNGDYNKVISAQYKLTENNVNFAEYQTLQPNANGLCNYCNNNVQLKVFQLANFVPLNENNYEMEIEHFEKQLEKAYRLCSNCTKVLKTTIQKQNARLFADRIKSLKKLTNKVSNYVELKSASFFTRLLQFSLLLCSILAASLIIEKHISTKLRLRNILLQYFKSHSIYILELLKQFYKELDSEKYVFESVKSYVPKNIHFHSNVLFVLTLLGFFVHSAFLILSKQLSLNKVNQTIVWITLSLTSGVAFHQNFVVFIDTIQIFSSIWMIYSYSLPEKKIFKKKYVMKKVPRNTEEDYYSDDEELYNSSTLNDTNRPNNTIKKTKTATNRLNRSFTSTINDKTDFLNDSTNSLNYNDFTPTKSGLNTQFNMLNITQSSPKSYMSPSIVSKRTSNPFLTQNHYLFASPEPVFHSPNKYFDPNILNRSFSSRNRAFSPDFNNQSQNISRYSFSGNLNDSFSSATSVCNLSINPGTFCSNDPPFLSPKRGTFSDSFDEYHSPNNSISSIGLLANNTIPSSPCMSVFSNNINVESKATSLFRSNESVKSDYRFRPLSPQSCISESNRSILSPSKFNSPLSSPSIFKLSNYNKNHAVSSYNYLNNGELLLGDKHAVFSSNVSSNSISNNPFVDNCISVIPRHNSGSSRSSSRSSGFISSNELPNLRSNSLPGSRRDSPERNSILSEPPYHLKYD